MNIENFNPTDVRYIKLGEKGKWEKSCIEDDSTIRVGFNSNQHKECLAGNKWDELRSFWLKERNGNKAEATKDLTEIQAFYTMPPSTLWITFYNRLLYWCFAEQEVKEHDDDKSLIRKTIDGWSCKTLTNELLHVSNIDGRVSKVQGFRRTICKVEYADYLLNKIRGKQQQEVIDAKKAFYELAQQASRLISGLWWHDFELLTDLIFSRAGWQRISVLGKTEKDIDIDMISPVTGKRAFVQVKSSSDYQTFNSSLESFRSSKIYDEMFFVVHTVRDEKLLKHTETNISVIGPTKLAELTINSGLMDWLIKKNE